MSQAEGQSVLKTCYTDVLVDKEQIVAEIRRVASENGVAAGRQAFARATGIRMSEWYPHIWLGWNEALAEAASLPTNFRRGLPIQF